VVRVFDVSVSELLDESVHREERWVLESGPRAIHFFELAGETVWGATAQVLATLLEHLCATR
jgi:hypothetical protein